MKINLFPVAYRTTLGTLAAGVLYFVFNVAIGADMDNLRTSFAPMIALMFSVAFWIMVWCLTPKRWWDF